MKSNGATLFWGSSGHFLKLGKGPNSQEQQGDKKIPYNLVEIPCPCGSGKHLVGCHGLTDEQDHWRERVESFLGALCRYQDEDAIRHTFLKSAYKKLAGAADTFLKSVQDLSSISIRTGGNAHTGVTLSLRDDAEDSRPINLIPDIVLFVPDALELETEDGVLVIQQGIFEASTYSYVVDGSGLAHETIMRIHPITGGDIFLNGKKVDKAFIEQEYFFGLVASGVIFIRSFICVSWEAVKHSAA